MKWQKEKESSELSILMIEDNPADVRLVREALSQYAFSLSFKLSVAPTLADGLDILASQKIDIVLLDLNLPDSFGYGTFSDLSKHWSDGPIVVLSSGSDEELALRTVSEGAQDYLFKDSLDNPTVVVRTLRYAHGRYQSRLEILAAENRLSSIFQAVSDGIVIVDRENNIRFANPAAEALLASRAGIVGQKFPFPVDTEGEIEVGAPQSNGETLILALKATIADWNGISAFCVSLRDVTQRKQMAEELIRAREEAFRASSAKSEFLARMSHEIRTPLNAIIGMATLLQETPLSDEQKRYVKIFERAGGTLSAILNDLLDLSKIELGEMKLETTEFQIDELVEHVCELVSLRAHQKGIELNFHISPDVPTSLTGDPHRLHQILLNLLTNAVKFTQVGGIFLSVENEDRERPNGGLLFSVADTGVGIPREHWDSVFESFRQVDASVSRKYGGTGLGLAICKKLVEMMQGQIWLSSTQGLGTTFYFTSRFGMQPSQRPKAKVDDINLQGRSALVVDDNAISRMIMHESLQRMNCKVEELGSSEDALERVKKLRESGEGFDFIFADARLPGMDGFELARQLREMFKVGALKPPSLVVMISSYHVGDKLKAVEEGANDAYLVKPVKRAELLQTIRHLVRPNEPELKEVLPVEPKAEVRTHGPILVVDDSEDNREIIQAFLRRSGHKMQFATNGLEALERFRATEFGLVLMDMQMPEMDGFTATREIRKLEAETGRARTSVVALTAYALKQDQENCYKAGCDYHLSKPISKTKLLEIVDRYYGRGA